MNMSLFLSLPIFVQDGTERTDYFTCAAVGEDGSVVLAGESAGSWNGLKKGSLDFIAIKIDSEGEEMWRWQVKL